MEEINLLQQIGGFIFLVVLMAGGLLIQFLIWNRKQNRKTKVAPKKVVKNQYKYNKTFISKK